MQDGPYGITCPTCSQKLGVRQTSVFIASTVILFAPMLFVALVIEPYTQYFRGNDVLTIASVVVVIAPLFWIQTKYAKRFAGLRDLDAGEVVSFPLEAAPFDPFAYEFKKTMGRRHSDQLMRILKASPKLGGVARVVRRTLLSSNSVGNVEKIVPTKT